MLTMAVMPLPAFGWSSPLPVPELATGYHEFTPWITPDGMRLYFVAVYPFGFGGNDIFFRDRQPDGSWGPILNLGPPINSAADERAPCLSPDGRTFIFTSYGRRNQPAVTSIYCSQLLLNGQWSEPRPFEGSINSKYSEFTAYPSHDGNRMFFTSYRPGGTGNEDIWCIAQVSGGWGEAYPLKPPINSKASERTEAVGWGDDRLFFCSDRPFGLGDEDLYMARLDGDKHGGTVQWLGVSSRRREYSPTYDALNGVLYFCRMNPGSRSRGMDIYMSRAKLPWGEDGPTYLARLFNTFQHF
jgi:hypothetical protein